MNTKRTLTYSISGEGYFIIGGEERGEPSAHIVIEFPPVAENLPTFRASLESIFSEILEACK